MVAVYDVVEIAGISQMYDSIQAVLTSQLRYRALWNESTAAKTVMSYQSRIVPKAKHASTVITVCEAEVDEPLVAALSCALRQVRPKRRHIYVIIK